MKRPASVGIVLMIFLVGFAGLVVGPATASTMVIYEWQITDEGAMQVNPDIWGDRIVWQDDRNGNWDIYLFTDGSTFEPETPVMTHPSNQMNPAISDDRIVYHADTYWNWDIFMYDLGNQTETRITTNNSVQQFPDIHENRIVWQDDRNGNWDIYLYDLVNGTEQRLTWSGKNTNPAIYGDRVVYLKNDVNVYLVNLPTGTETHIATIAETHSKTNKDVIINPAIHEHLVAFAEGHTYNYGQNIAFTTQLFDLSTNQVIWTTATDGDIEDNPDIDGEYVVFQDDRNGKWDIYLYDYRTAFLKQVTTNSADQINPRVSSPRIVYQDYRNGNWDIYLAKIGFVPDIPPTPGPGDAATGTTGTLHVSSHPAGATILINGTEYGTTNSVVRNVPAGNQNLTLTKTGYHPETIMVDVPERFLKVLDPITLTREGDGGGVPGEAGTLSVASHPTGATILINGTEYGTTNSVVRNVPAGNQNLTLTKTGYHPETIMIDVPERFLKVLDPITLTREGDGGGVSGETGTLSVASYPAGATILINGTEYGTTNSVVKHVPAGNQNLTLTKDGYHPYSTMVDVPERFLKVLDPVTLTSS